MPGLPDKWIINNNGFNGRVAAINAEFNTGLELGDEIIAMNLVKQTFQQRDEMKVECAKIDAALDEYLDYLRKTNNWMAEFIDNNLP
jgi:hypothetical protein